MMLEKPEPVKQRMNSREKGKEWKMEISALFVCFWCIVQYEFILFSALLLFSFDVLFAPVSPPQQHIIDNRAWCLV